MTQRHRERRGNAKKKHSGAWFALMAIRAYQGFVSPLLPLGCRFYPTCSHYAAEAVEKHGAARGMWLAATRILRCRPFGSGGYDPVPEQEEFERHLHAHEVNGA